MRNASLLTILALAACAKSAQAPAPESTAEPVPDAEEALPPLSAFMPSDLASDGDPCVDLNHYVNSTWIAANPMPDDRTSWGSFEMITERSLAVQRRLVETAAANLAATGTQKLIGDIWSTGMNEGAIEAAGLTPIQPYLDEIDALDGPEAIAALLRTSSARGHDSLLSFGGFPDFQDSSLVIAYFGQGGMGLPDKTYYFDETHAEVRTAYVAYIAELLTLGGASAEQAAAGSDQVWAFELALAQASHTSEELARDVSLYYNPVTVAQAHEHAPAIGWASLFEANGMQAPERFSMGQPAFFTALDELIRTAPLDQWQAYLRFHMIDGSAPYLTAAMSDARFGFYGRTLRGQKVQRPRWKRVLGTVNETVGMALGELYVAEAFPPESKARMEVLVANLSSALKGRIENLDWMGPETQTKALEKWASFTPKIGYPDEWRDWSGMETSRDSYVGNLISGLAYNHAWEVSKIGQPVDLNEWQMSPQMVNAYYNPLQNEIVFPAAILQPPFFDAEADEAMNFGGIGAVIGHEMIHGYDDQGSRFDAAGNFANWWTPEDLAGFQGKTAALVAQFDAYEVFEGLPVNGNLTLGENIADLGGLTIAYAAMIQAQGEDFTDPMIDGFTQSQRFFLNWGTLWRRGFTEEEARLRVNTDSHAPSAFRANGAPSNLPEFAQAWSCEVGSEMVRSEADRIVIW
jgi:putative endopeptidase